MRKILPHPVFSPVLAFICALFAATSAAQTASPLLNARYPDLVNYFNAFDMIQAAIFEEVVLTKQSAEAEIGKQLLQESLQEFARAKTSHYHSSSNHLAMLGPYRVFESRATPGLIAMIRQQHDTTQANLALATTAVLPSEVVAVLNRGRDFVSGLTEIYLDDEILDKHLAVDALLADYLSADAHSVAALPKSSDLLSKHAYAYAYRVGFPQLSGLTWASQWLQLASLEIMLMASSDRALDVGIETATAIYVEKIARLHNSLMSLPGDIPSMPVIAPNVYSFHPGAAYVVDNLSMLKVVIGDILAHPDVSDHEAELKLMLARFTDKNQYLEDEIDYLTFVLRGGIFNQGGPAFGGMSASERNRSRDSLENPHISRFPMSP